MKKTILYIVLLFGVSDFANGQISSCPNNAQYPACSPPCMTITVVNYSNCAQLLYWNYSGSSCAIHQPYGYVAVAPFGGVATWQGPCMQFCDDPCECPTSIEYADEARTTTLNPFGSFGSWVGSSTTTYYGANTCAACGSGLVKVTLTVGPGVNPSSATLTFDCQ